MEINRGILERLYLKEKKSAHQIATILGCSDNKVTTWLKKYGIKKRSISEATYVYRNPHGDPFAFSQPIRKEDIFLMGLGLGLYWGEGTKRDRLSVRLGNTDPALIKKFLEFLMRIYCVDEKKLRFGLQIFDDMDPESTKRFWIKTLRVRARQFGKIIITPSRGKGTYREKTKHGVLTIYFSNTKLRALLGHQIEELGYVS